MGVYVPGGTSRQSQLDRIEEKLDLIIAAINEATAEPMQEHDESDDSDVGEQFGERNQFEPL